LRMPEPSGIERNAHEMALISEGNRLRDLR
jgi:hypothetical protein